MSLDIEVTTWSEDRIKDEIILRLDSGWIFKFGPAEDQMAWEASILKPDETEVWSSSKLTAQLVLLDALGWLENRNHKLPETSPWVRKRGDLNPQRAHDIAYSQSLGPPDPPHLDPDEIESVIRSTRKGN
jgi:hypothetical protein